MGFFDHMDDDRRRQVFGVLLLFLGLLLAASLGTHVYLRMAGAMPLGATNASRAVSTYLFELLGVIAWVVPVLSIAWGWNRLVDGDAETLALRSVFLTATGILVMTLIHVAGGPENVTGVVGTFLSETGSRHIGSIWTFIAGVGAIILIALLTTEFDIDALTYPFLRMGELIAGWAGSFADWAREFVTSLFDREERSEPRRERKRAAPKASRRRQEPSSNATKGTARRAARGRRKRAGETDPHRSQPASRPAADAPPARRKSKQPTIMQPSKTAVRAATKVRKTTSYRLPPISLLDDPPANAHNEVSRDELLTRSKLLEEKLADFGVEATVAQVQPGPIITRFEIEPARGVKVSQIANLQDDLALAMRATAIRIIAPIPGKGAVGIEIPNANPAVVYLKDTLASDVFDNLATEIPLALGKDTTGKVYCSDLAKMPHLLVAGATGSGKSICLNTLITGILFRSTPDEVRFLMIDPKRLELTRYADIPHLLSPVVTEAKSAAMALQWLVGEMDRRYDMLSLVGVRDIYGFNKRIADRDDLDALRDEQRVRLPHVVVVVDEFADLMVRAPREVEAPVQRLAQMARAVGIHLVFATQRPSVDVITGVIKANFASRIAFRVISMTDSRTVLDRNGAQTLLGNGDMLFLPTGKPDPIRLHGAFMSSQETARIVSHWRGQGKPDYLFDFEDAQSVARMSAVKSDELYEQALEVVVGTQMGSTSLLQRRLSVGYARAGRLMDLLEANGIVGPFQGSKARDVLVGPEYLEHGPGVAVALEDPPEAPMPGAGGLPDDDALEYAGPGDDGEDDPPDLDEDDEEEEYDEEDEEDEEDEDEDEEDEEDEDEDEDNEEEEEEEEEEYEEDEEEEYDEDDEEDEDEDDEEDEDER